VRHTELRYGQTLLKNQTEFLVGTTCFQLRCELQNAAGSSRVDRRNSCSSGPSITYTLQTVLLSRRMVLD
jgi:hypothetical protein